MASKRKDGRWQETFLFDGKRYWAYANSRAALPAAISEKMESLKNQKQNHDDPTLDAYNKIWMECRSMKVKESTLRNYWYWYNDVANIVLPAGMRLGSLRMNSVKPADIRYVQQKLCSAGKSARTVNGVLAHLSDIFKTAVKDETISKNPCMIIETVKQDRAPARETKHRALTQEETSVFFAAATGSFYYNLFRMLIQTGMRIGEACALSAADIDLKNGVINVTKTVTRDEIGAYMIGSTPKTSSGNRQIPVNNAIREIAEDQKQLTRELFGLQIGGSLFVSADGSIIREYTVNREIARICKDAGIERFTCHAFRATFATRFIEQRPHDYKVLQEILGHANIKITLNLYTHVMKESKVRAMEDLAINY